MNGLFLYTRRLVTVVMIDSTNDQGWWYRYTSIAKQTTGRWWRSVIIQEKVN